MLQATSLKTYVNEVAPTLGVRQVLVLEAFEAMGGDLTNAELARALEWSINRVTPRVHELRQSGILEESQRRRCRVTGRQVHAWKPSSHPKVPASAIRSDTLYQVPSRSDLRKTHVIRETSTSATCQCKGFYFRGTCAHLRKLGKKPGLGDITQSLFS